ncbi:MAG: formylmethanofuran dehydrogenase subunit A [Rhodospirillaceae bacterium]|nr:formylmethanofuran dehydrogenase subunit A [Rhodospirillaceae bacterium]
MAERLSVAHRLRRRRPGARPVPLLRGPHGGGRRGRCAPVGLRLRRRGTAAAARHAGRRAGPAGRASGRCRHRAHSRRRAGHRPPRAGLPHRRRGGAAAGAAAALGTAGPGRRADPDRAASRRRRADGVSLVKLAGGMIVDPANGRDRVVADLYIAEGRIVPDPGPDARVERVFDVSGRIVMAGGIDIHSHLAGGKVNYARTLMIDDHRARADRGGAGLRSGGGVCTPSSFSTGYRYALMGYTAAFEPAMLPSNARHTHVELADVPMIDKGCYALLGNDDILLGMLARGESRGAIADYVGWTLEATQALAVKLVNPGGVSAFKFNQRALGFDEPAPGYGVSPRRILHALARAVHDLGLAHPLHLHCNDLGMPGNVETTLRSVAAVEGLRLHLAHVQFHSYGTDGRRGFSSAARRIAEAVNDTPGLSIDVGQVAFGQTVTASGDTVAQERTSRLAHPRKWLGMDIECEAGCGVVPFRYRERSFVNAVQWTIGLELLLMVEDPWRVFLTTDHPNGAPFTAYPHLIRLLMDRTFREEMLARIHPAAAEASALRDLGREYSLYEIAILTRAGPARILGLADRGHLGPGAAADVVVYTERADREAMFACPDLVFKDGRLVVRDGAVVEVADGATHVARPQFDAGIEAPLRRHFEAGRTMRLASFRIDDGEIEEAGGRLVRHPCTRTGA